MLIDVMISITDKAVVAIDVGEKCSTHSFVIFSFVHQARFSHLLDRIEAEMIKIIPKNIFSEAVGYNKIIKLDLF